LFARHGRGLTVTLFAFCILAADSLSTTRSMRLTGSAVAAPAGSRVETDSRPPRDPRTIELVGLQDQFAAVAVTVARSVVAISAAADAVNPSDEVLRSDDLNTEKLERVLSRGTRMVGTGMVIDADGYILTNEHVVGEAEQLWVTTDDRKVYPAIIVGSDPRSDLAVLKIPAQGMTPVRFAAAKDVKRGQWTIALGNPYGLAAEGELSMSVGIVSAVDRSLNKLASKENRLYTNLIQTTAEINPGNSGGPLFDLNGDVIGVNTAVILPNKQANGIGFALPITPTLMATVRDLKQGREIVYGYMGVLVSTPTPAQRRSAGVMGTVGARVDSIESSSPAAGTDLRAGDIVVSVNGNDVLGSDQFVRLVGQTPVEKPAFVSVCRDGKVLTIDITPRKRPMPSVAVTRENQRLRWRGMVLAPIPVNWSNKAAAPGAAGKKAGPMSGLMVVGMDDTSPFARQGIKLGSIVTSIAGKAVTSLLELQQVIEATPPELCAIETDGSSALASSEQ
jgi:serine protease Do